MTYSFIKKQTALAVSCALTLVIASGAVLAQTDPAAQGYLTDQRGLVVRSGFGLCWRSGSDPSAAATAECDPVAAPIAKAVEPAPQRSRAVVAAPEPTPKPVAVRVTLDAETLFDFNKADLRPAGRAALDEFVGKIKDINTEVIMAVGHADRFGSEAYNQRLSEHRAAAVKTYLLGKGIEPNRIQTEGRGETQPVTKAGECSGAKSAKVIACLQPDRRVAIEVVGSQIPK